MQLAVPVATLIAFGVHLLFAKNAPPLETHSYILLFWEILGVSIVLAIAQTFWAGLRQWMRHMWPIFTAAILLLGVWDAITLGFHLLPLPYFPGPAAVLRSLIIVRALLLDMTWLGRSAPDAPILFFVWRFQRRFRIFSSACSWDSVRLF